LSTLSNLGIDKVLKELLISNKNISTLTNKNITTIIGNRPNKKYIKSPYEQNNKRPPGATGGPSRTKQQQNQLTEYTARARKTLQGQVNEVNEIVNNIPKQRKTKTKPPPVHPPGVHQV